MKQENINTVKGLACVALVFYHVIGATPGHAMQISDGAFRVIADSMGFIRMPVFAFIAGYLYSRKQFTVLFFNKFIRLIIPMLTVGTFFAVVKHVAISPVDFSTLHIIPVAHYWFIEAIFLCFLVASFVDNFCNRLTLHFVAFFSVVVSCIDPNIEILSINKVFYLMPFFMMGVFARRDDERGLLMLVFAVLITFAFYESEAMAIAFSGLFPLLLIKHCGKVDLFDFIGRHSYAIYLFHVFFTAPVVIALKGWSDIAAILLALVAGVLSPIAINKLTKNKYLRLAVLGDRIK